MNKKDKETIYEYSAMCWNETEPRVLFRQYTTKLQDVLKKCMDNNFTYVELGEDTCIIDRIAHKGMLVFNEAKPGNPYYAVVRVCPQL